MRAQAFCAPPSYVMSHARLYHKVVKPKKSKKALGRKRRRQRERAIAAWSATSEAIRQHYN